MKSGFWESGLVSRGRRGGAVIPSLESNVYDLGVAAATRTLSDRIAVIAIEDASLENIGRLAGCPSRANRWHGSCSGSVDIEL